VSHSTDVGCISEETEVKKLLLVGTTVLLIATSASAQTPGPGVIMSGDNGRWHGYMPEGYIGSYSHANRLANRQQTNGSVQQVRNGTVPKFCYSLRTGKFTHWGPCRQVRLPTGQWVKVAH
jgi:hypothetical protein